MEKNNEIKNILFIGLLYDIRDEEKLISENKKGVGLASNLLQTNFIKSIQKSDKLKINVIGSLPVGNFPFYSEKVYYKSHEYYINNTLVKLVRTLNLPFLKHTVRYYELKIMVKYWLKENDYKGIIIFYDFYKPFLKLTNWIRSKKYAEVKTIGIIPDLIGNLRNETNTYNLFKKIDYRKNNKRLEDMNKQDGLIGVSSLMRDDIFNNKFFLEINGIVNDEIKQKKSSISSEIKEKNINYMYAGNLSKQYNVDKMIVEFIEADIEGSLLFICGSGELSMWIKEKSKENRNIKYLGILPKKKVDELSIRIDVMINPRPSTGEYTKYSFPSKNLEYLLQSKPIICFKLPPFKNKFDEVFDYFDESLDKPFLNKFIEYSLKTKEELLKKGEFNYEFVKSNFGLSSSADKLEKFLINLADDNTENN